MKDFIPVFLTPDDAAFLESCGTSWGNGNTAAQMRAEGMWILVGVIELEEEVT